MQPIKCIEVWVRFVSPNHQGQRISFREETRAHFLKVQRVEGALVISFRDKDGDVIKTVTFNWDHVLEYTTEGWIDPDYKQDCPECVRDGGCFTHTG